MDEKPWRDVHRRIVALDRNWEKIRFRKAAIADIRLFLIEKCAEVPHLFTLARLFRDEMTRQDLWSALVPVERALSRTKITDVDILSHDREARFSKAAVFPFSVLADNFRSALNLGGIFRTAECFGLSEIILTGYSPAPSDPRVAAAALGTESQIPYRRFGRALEAVTALQGEGKQCVALETVENAPNLNAFSWPFPAVLILGSERFGLDPETVAACDGVVRIPMYGGKNSLNVVTAFAIAAYAARTAFERGMK